MNQAIGSEAPIIRLQGVTKKFDNRAVIEDCSVALYPSHVYGLVGRSGSGKSTLLRLMLGIYLPSSGQCSVFNETPPQLTDNSLSRIGYVHQEDELINWFTGAQFFGFIRSHYTKWNETLLQSIVYSLEIPVSLTIKNLSQGERQCLAIAAALAHEPDILILDEPASALDPLRRERFIRILLEYMSTKGRTVLISSHLLSDLDRVIDHLLVLHDRTTICDAPLDVAKSMFRRMVVVASESDIRSCGVAKEIVSLEPLNSVTTLVISEKGAAAIRQRGAALGWHVEEGAVSLEETFQFLVADESKSKLTSDHSSIGLR